MPSLPAALTDAVLDATVVPGYTRPGYHLRRRLYHWDDDWPRMDGQVALVTGATSGIGRATALRLAELGAAIRSVSRDAERARAATHDLRQASGNHNVEVEVLDLSRPRDVEAYAARFVERHDRLDVLVHDAGAFFKDHTVTADGVEANAALYLLGPFVLTSALSPLLDETPGARIVTVTTGGMYLQRLDVDVIEASADGYRPLQAYAHVKRGQVALTHEWASRYPDASVSAVQPGWCETPLVEEGLPRFRRTLGPLLRDPDQGADTVAYLAANSLPPAMSGRLWHDRLPRGEHRLPWTRTGADEDRRLWDWCAARSGHLPRPAQRAVGTGRRG